MSSLDSSQTNSAITALNFNIDQNAGLISVKLASEHPAPSTITTEHVLDELKRLGVANWDIQLPLIDKFLANIQKGALESVDIGYRRDAFFSITIAPDKMKATAHMTPAMGGEPASYEQLFTALTQQGVAKKRIILPALKQAVSALESSEFDVALGLAPQRGQDTQFIERVSDASSELTDPNSDDTIDFLAGRIYSTVLKGTPLLERIAALPGKVGQDIFGNIVQPEHGVDLPFDTPFEGASIAPDNPNMVIADIDGHPVYSPGKVNVEPTLRFENVDLSTGHVSFNGSVEITGDVLPGLHVEASGDIFVRGTVERAVLKSGANITVQGGVIGESPHDANPKQEDATSKADEKESNIDYAGIVTAVGELTLKYANEVKLTANNIHAKEYVFNSLVNVQQGLYIGQSGGHGQLAGGNIQAGHCIIAKEIGSPAYQKTTLHIVQGDPQQNVKKLLFLQEKRTEQLLRLHQLLDALPPDQVALLNSSAHKKSLKITEALADLNFMLTDIKQRLANAEQARYSEQPPFVQATQRCYPNCYVSINHAPLVTDKELKACTFARKGQSITITL
ncbi:FapA family protein [Reinekea forsetii]|nr:FapA family protein [Reinekea forsetii]